MRASRAINPTPSLIAVPDSGFVEEAEEVIKAYGPDSVLLIRLHRVGRDFAGDSRSYISLPVKTVEIHNDDSLDWLREDLLTIVGAWLEG